MWDDGAIWKGAGEGQLLLQTCNNCQAIRHPPLPMCPTCQSAGSHQVAASGRARLKDWLVSDGGRIVIVAELEEGVRFVSNLLEAPPEACKEGLALELYFVEADGLALPQFRPAA